jgi:hypothetical protein
VSKRATPPTEAAKARPAPAVHATEDQPARIDNGARPEVYEEQAIPDPIAPTTGIEIIDAYDQDGERYYTLRTAIHETSTALASLV